MDPSQLQSDKDNDTNSLESEVIDASTDSKSTNTSSGSLDSSATEGNDSKDSSDNGGKKSSKPPFFKRIWQKFNIYLLLFVLVILVAVGVTLGLFLKNKSVSNTNKTTIGAQNLSTEALKQLADTSVTVGNANQVLNVKSNAIFSNAVLVQGDLEVAGRLKSGGDLQLPNITVSGTGRFSQLQADSLAVNGNESVQGQLTVQKGLNVSGSGSFTGTLSAAQISTSSLQINGDFTLTQHLVAGGPVPNVGRGSAVGNGGTASLGGSDTAGSITINTGSGTGAGCFATVNFVRRYNSTPHVIVTPVGSGAAGLSYYVNRSTSDFSVCTASPAPSGQSFGFDYFVVD
jgi:cytoskeletal protein CcmA (bactofilin family)